MTLDERIGENLRIARAAAGLSSLEAAQLLGETEFNLKQLETGTRRASANLLARAAQAFQVEIRWFFDQSNPPTSKHSMSPSQDETDAASITLLESLRANKTLAQLCEALRESEYAGQKDSKVA